ncbi:hypothetical protein AAFC00_002137 [Neodothiora populina]|uniref:Plasma membrane fusion protein PRM1 n=1 Tax=Neodothiora populina TaxID=2781224 RepID=A0ABR3PGD9_9PEZI
MASSENQQQAFPAAPPITSAGEHEMRDYYAAPNASRPTPNYTLYLTPYLGLRARLSQVWINRWTVLLLLVLFRTLLAITSMDSNLTSARSQALSACRGVENVGSAMASMPYYMAQGTNELTAEGIEKAISGLISMLLLTITGVEEIVVFVINLLTSTYVCLITFAVGGSLHAVIDIAEFIGDALNSTVKGVGDDLGDAVNDFQTAMNKFVGAIDDVGSFFSGKDVHVPTLDLNSSIAKLDSLQLPSGYDQDLSKLNQSIPTFAQVNNLTNQAIKYPFEEVKKLLNESLSGRYTINRSIFPVPQKEKLVFCSDSNGIDDFFDDLVHIEHLAKKIFLAVLILAAILVCIPMAYREIRRYRFMQDRARAIKDVPDPMDSVYLVSRPYTSTAGLKIAEHFSSSRQRTLVRWTVAYATTTPALFVLCLALAGLLGCLCQYILLRAIEKEVPALTQQVDAFADKVVGSLNNASMQWAVGTNHIINSTNTKINEDVFGWVNTTTGAVNETLNVFVDGMMDVLNVTFGDTVLYDPVLEVLNCLVLLKIKGIEKALTWVSDNAHVDFPLLANDTFSLGTLDKVNKDSNSSDSVLATGPGDDASDEITSAVSHVTHAIASTIRQEAIISTCVLMVWVLIVLIGLLRAGFLMRKKDLVNSNVYAMEALPAARFASNTTSNDPPHGSFDPTEKSVDVMRVPTYEQATATNTASNEGNRWNAQTYTLSPRRFPQFQVNGETSPILSSGFSPSEKVGFVGSQNVEAATRRPVHIRASSHGNFAVTSPVDEPGPPHDERKKDRLNIPNPFADRAP